jgi:hypothetical protein
VRDQLGSHNVSDEGREIWGHSIHSLSEVLGQSLSEGDEVDASLRKSFDLKLIGLGHILSH